MYSRANKHRLAIFGLALFGLVGSAARCWADPIDTAGRFRVEGALVAGEGINDSRLITTTDGTQIKLSGGGGLGGRFTLGYGLTSKWDVEVGAEYKQSHGDQQSSNANATFTRYPVLVAAKYKIPVASVGQVKLGAGPGLFLGGKLDSDLTKLGLPHEVIDYKPALGAHVSAEWETIHEDWSFVFGIRYYYVSYPISSATLNGSALPTNLVGPQLRDLDGSAFEFIVGLGRYF
ncbi:outer membrane beta-barrel protein [Geomesophilobacter sediminis]|uniref:Outer membrane beta-barrel protein n=1 Tax=Geomesophilobacter sediminis TaxID=2798584 RepID=A0A8J7IRJ2_9BACT|nr:outer membrane beta-barrel protein [Geomesophilobacter sediminis]MBJ6725539.1 outer membrane beta-barrel protein [Geomesophilobacter sediminis]